MPSKAARLAERNAKIQKSAAAKAKVEAEKSNHQKVEKKNPSEATSDDPIRITQVLVEAQQMKSRNNAIVMAFGTSQEQKRYLDAQKRMEPETIEVIQRYRDNLAVDGPLRCYHYNQDTFAFIECDCTQVSTCGCRQKFQCQLCMVQICSCPLQNIHYKPIPMKPQHPLFCGTQTLEYIPSTRAGSRMALGKTILSRRPPSIKITRYPVGLLIGRKSGTNDFDRECIRCYHYITAMNIFLECCCSRDGTTHTFTLSSKLLELQKDGMVITIDENGIRVAESLVAKMSPDNSPHRQQNIVNPFGLLGDQQPIYRAISPAEKRIVKKWQPNHPMLVSGGGVVSDK